jgi:hypothetical protein
MRLPATRGEGPWAKPADELPRRARRSRSATVRVRRALQKRVSESNGLRTESDSGVPETVEKRADFRPVNATVVSGRQLFRNQPILTRAGHVPSNYRTTIRTYVAPRDPWHWAPQVACRCCRPSARSPQTVFAARPGPSILETTLKRPAREIPLRFVGIRHDLRCARVGLALVAGSMTHRVPYSG